MTVSNKLRKELNKKLGRKVFFINLFVVLIFLVALIFCGAYGGMRTETARDIFPRNVSIDGIEVGGLSFEEAEKLVLADRQQFLDGLTVTVAYEGQDFTFDVAQLAVSTNASQVLEEAYGYNKQPGSVWDNFGRTVEPVAYETAVELDEEQLYKNMEKAFSQFSEAPVNATAEFQAGKQEFRYSDGKEGRSVDIDQLCREIATDIDKGGEKKVAAQVKVLLPQFTKEALKENSQQISECKTPLDGNDARKRNIEQLCSAVNGAAVQPGETFSINAFTGGYSTDKGYVDAPIEEDGMGLEKEIGGGVTQFAGTLYNAALLADMEIIEREKAQWPPSYLKVGLDAGLRYDDIDLKLKNRSNYPMYIGAFVEDDVLYVELYGQPLPNQVVIENRELNYIEAPHAEVLYSDEYPEGEQHEKSISRPGYEVEVYRHYLENGKTVSSELVSYDVYKEIRGVIMQGTGDS